MAAETDYLRLARYVTDARVNFRQLLDAHKLYVGRIQTELGLPVVCYADLVCDVSLLAQFASAVAECDVRELPIDLTTVVIQLGEACTELNRATKKLGNFFKRFRRTLIKANRGVDFTTRGELIRLIELFNSNRRLRHRGLLLRRIVEHSTHYVFLLRDGEKID